MYKGLLILAFSLIAAQLKVDAHCSEILISVTNTNGVCICIPVKVYDYANGNLVWQGSSSTVCNSAEGDNLRIDLNNNCSGNIPLNPSRHYVIQFHFPEGVRSVNFSRNEFCSEFPVFDSYYHVTPSTFSTIQSVCFEEFWGYPYATVYQPLNLSLDTVGSTRIGDKVTHQLRATATGGSVPNGYTFSWSNASPTSSATTNPNTAYRTVIYPVTVTVSVTNGTESMTRSIVISNILE